MQAAEQSIIGTIGLLGGGQGKLEVRWQPGVWVGKLDLTDEEFALVSSDIPPIVPSFQTYVEFGDWMEEAWTEMITS